MFKIFGARKRRTTVLFKFTIITFISVFAVLLFICYEVLFEKKLKESSSRTDEGQAYDVPSADFDDNIKEPVILWWTPFTNEQGRLKKCGSHQCFFTINRKYRNHPQLKALLFYASNLDVGDLPVPRGPDHQWSLLHEESPKNNFFLFCHEEIMTLFNHTSTFRRQSDCPITTLHLDSLDTLESKQYLVPVQEKNRLMRDEGLALINFVQTDCDTPSDRDTFVKMLQRHLKVDSYGKCLQNKELPQHLRNPIGGMDHKDFYRLQAKYKFTLAMENAVCDDYVTEKFWRPFAAGSVPIVYGSPKIKDWLPDNHSAIVIKDFAKVDDIVQLLLRLNSSDAEYESYLSFKSKGVSNDRLRRTMTERPWAIHDWTRPNFVSNFECCVCERLHAQIRKSKRGIKMKHRATVDHYGCPKPTRFSDKPMGNLQQVEGGGWNHEWDYGYRRARAVAQLVRENKTFLKQDVDSRVRMLQHGGL